MVRTAQREIHSVVIGASIVTLTNQTDKRVSHHNRQQEKVPTPRLSSSATRRLYPCGCDELLGTHCQHMYLHRGRRFPLRRDGYIPRRRHSIMTSAVHGGIHLRYGHRPQQHGGCNPSIVEGINTRMRGSTLV